MNEQPEKLSDIDINVHGFTEDDVIECHIARNEMIRQGARRGNWFCEQSQYLDAIAKNHGIDVTYNEELDDEDLL